VPSFFNNVVIIVDDIPLQQQEFWWTQWLYRNMSINYMHGSGKY